MQHVGGLAITRQLLVAILNQTTTKEVIPRMVQAQINDMHENGKMLEAPITGRSQAYLCAAHLIKVVPDKVKEKSPCILTCSLFATLAKKSMARCIASIERHPVSTVFTFSMLIKPYFV